VSLLDDFDILIGVVEELGGSAGLAGEDLLELLSSSIMSAVNRIQDIDFSVLNDETIRGMFARVSP
jgi:hypothetical protein